jgi:S1-C subfamily serine protease
VTKVRIAGALSLLFVLALLAVNLTRLRRELAHVKSRNERESNTLRAEKENLEDRVAAADNNVAALQSRVEALKTEQTTTGARLDESRRQTEGKLESLGTTVADRITGWEQKIRDSIDGAARIRADLETIRHSVPQKDVDRLYTDLLHPSVQVNARDAVGGGTLIHTEALAGGKYKAHILTAYHVIQKSISTKERSPIEVRLYRPDGTTMGNFDATLVSHSDARDIALLSVTVPEPVTTLARLAARKTLNDVRVFTPVYAVGCPLGHDPIPSIGEISSLHKQINGENFWMVNAPTIFGNSGGGIFHRETHEMIGISAMICTYDNLVATPVPHLSIVVSLETVYRWLDAQNLQYLYEH